ncbi:MAG TPA: carboxylesterase family protein [Bryobacteraceae bacterium]|nr:carboxylesterase family protein [Bryobacteraceae bacterium]
MPTLTLRLLTTAWIAWPMLAAIENPVRVDSGDLAGVSGSNPEVRVFKGIPYAAPPVGDLRWRAPKTAPKWQGVRQADHFSFQCEQTPYAAGGPYHAGVEPLSEDCLYLNVWTAAKSNQDRRPVMVWIHGGGLTRNSGSNPNFNGEHFAQKGVVLVTINYRLGVFGYFAHPELTKESDRNASGNQGFLDQIAALEWVQRNIAAFGGDPKRVTIFGESAGSWSVNVLVASPLAKGLFERAIGESGGQFARVQKLADAEQAGLRFAKSVGADSLAALRAKPAEELLKAQAGASAVVDGWFLPADVNAIFARGKQNDVPTLIGSNNDEGMSLTPPSIKLDAFRAQAKNRFGDQAGEFLKLYPAASDDQAHASNAAAMRDQTFGWEMRTWARAQSKTGQAKVYVYYFNKVPPGPFARLGAYHGSEIQYVFGTVPKDLARDSDRKLSDTLSSYWVNFAATGDPNGKGLPRWPAYQEKSDLALNLGDQIQAAEIPHKAALDFLDGFIAGQRSK